MSNENEKYKKRIAKEIYLVLIQKMSLICQICFMDAHYYQV